MDKELTQAGFDTSRLTPAQKDLIMQPSYGPENFHMDGEITPRQAFAFWKQKLERSGLSSSDVKRAVKMHFGE